MRWLNQFQQLRLLRGLNGHFFAITAPVDALPLAGALFVPFSALLTEESGYIRGHAADAPVPPVALLCASFHPATAGLSRYRRYQVIDTLARRLSLGEEDNQVFLCLRSSVLTMSLASKAIKLSGVAAYQGICGSVSPAANIVVETGDKFPEQVSPSALIDPPASSSPDVITYFCGRAVFPIMPELAASRLFRSFVTNVHQAARPFLQ